MRTRSQLRHVGQWPDGSAPMPHPLELTVAAKRLAANVIEELAKSGVSVTLDKAGRVLFHRVRTPSRYTRAAIERWGDLIESYLIEREPGG